MRSLNRGAALLVLVLLLAAGTSGQQPADQKKKVPAMSSDDLGDTPSARQPTVLSSTGGSLAGLTRYTLESCGLSIALPAAPFKSEMPLGGPDKKVLGSIKNYSSVGDGYVVVVSHVQVPGQPAFEGQLDTFVQGFFQGLSSSPGNSNVKYTIGDKSSSRVSFRGSYDMKAGPVELEGFAQLQGRHGWVVAALYPLANDAAVEPARKVLGSGRFDGPRCPE